jgi:cytochrome c biogenesis protein CcmG, thiol:disulfide interchange protein DsbE
MKSHKLKMTIIMFGVFFFSGLWGCMSGGDSEQNAPNFTLTALSGKEATLKEHRGSVVILDFWATWCPPCRMAIPELIKMQERYRDEGLVILGISLDDPRRTSDSYLVAFKEKYGINYKVLRYDEDIMKDYFGTRRPAIPTAFVIDREGRIKSKVVGFRPQALELAVKETLS